MPKREFAFRYRIRNWPEYNRALAKRGELTLWFDEEAVAAGDMEGLEGRKNYIRPMV